MPRTTKTITFSLPPEMADRVDEVMKQQRRSRSEFLRDAVLRYIRILECAVEASADYLVTGDRRHLLLIEGHQGARILNAPRFLLALEG